MNARLNHTCEAMQHLIVDALFDDIEEEAQQKLQVHLDQCESCAVSYQEMKSTLQMTSQLAEPALTEAYWEGFQVKLQHRLKQPDVSRASTMLLRPMLVGLRRFVQPLPTWSYQAAMAVLLIAVGVFIGRTTTSPDVPRPVATTGEGGAAGIMAVDTQRYLDRSNVLLLGLVNFDAEHDDLSVLNLEHKQAIAEELVQESAAIKKVLEAHNEQQLHTLIGELEKILLQIANLEAQTDYPGIEVIQQGVEHRALLLKINLESMKLLEEHSPSVPSQNLES